MPYYPGAQPTSGQSFGSIGQGINTTAAGYQQAQDQEKLRQFYAQLAQWQSANPSALGAGGAAGIGGPIGSGAGSSDDYTAALVGAARPTMPSTTQHYVQNAGVNALLNSVLNQGTGAAGGGKGKWAALLSSV